MTPYAGEMCSWELAGAFLSAGGSDAEHPICVSLDSNINIKEVAGVGWSPRERESKEEI